MYIVRYVVCDAKLCITDALAVSSARTRRTDKQRGLTVVGSRSGNSRARTIVEEEKRSDEQLLYMQPPIMGDVDPW